MNTTFHASSDVTNQHLGSLFPVRTLFREINRRANSGINFENIFGFIFESLSVYFPFERMAIALLENESTLRIRWIRSKTLPKYVNAGYTGPVSASLNEILQSGKPRIIHDLVEYLLKNPDSTVTKSLVADGIRSSLTCPLMNEGKAVGVVFFSSKYTDSYTGQHVESFQEIADELALLVHYGKLSTLNQASKSKDEVLRMTLHDLRAPLGIIQGFVTLLRDESWFHGLDADAKNLFSILSRNTEFMFELIDQLGDLNFLKHGKLSVTFESIELRGFCEEIIQGAKILSAKKNITLQADVDSNIPFYVSVDSKRIKQAIENLITNAIKFSYPGTTISFAVRSKGDQVEFSVQDHGQGISETEVPKLFHEFGKTSTKPTAGESSTGLGLAITKKIVEAHGGTVSVKSKWGEGSTFWLYVPLKRCV